MWFDGTVVLMLFYVLWLCMAINISVQYNGGLLPDIILLIITMFDDRCTTLFLFLLFFWYPYIHGD